MIFGIVSVCFLLTARGLYVEYEVTSRNWTPVDSVIEGFVDGNPVLRFDLNGETWHYHSSMRSSGQQLGDRVALRVNPANAAECLDGTLPLLALVFAAVGVSMGVIPVGLTVADRRRRAVLDDGLRETVTVTDIRLNPSMTLNGRHPSRLFASCTHPMTHETVEIHSHNLWDCPYQVGDRVEVAFDQMKPGRYAFDVKEKEQRA